MKRKLIKALHFIFLYQNKRYGKCLTRNKKQEKRKKERATNHAKQRTKCGYTFIIILTMKLNRILLVEDNPNDIELILGSLKGFNLANAIDVVNDGVEALEYLRSGGKYKNSKNSLPAVILLDIKMPRMDGIEVLKEIRNDPALKLIPVVMLTSSREDQDLIKSYTLGVNAYVVKPVEFNQFTEVIKTLGFFWAILNEPPR